MTPREREEAKFDLNLSYLLSERGRGGVFVIFVECMVGGRGRWEREGDGKFTIANETRKKGGYGVFVIFVVYHGREREEGIKIAIANETEYMRNRNIDVVSGSLLALRVVVPC